MPRYEYECEQHGAFQEWRAMAEAGAPAPCPICRQLRARAVAAPRLGIAAATRKAHAMNERSANEPRVVRKRRDEPIPIHDPHRDLTAARGHASGHQHHRDHHHETHSDGQQTHRSNHPWAVRH